MDYDLSRLNSRSFEQLIQVLAAKVLGQGLVVFGDGPDGGREATIQGRVPYPTGVSSGSFEGMLRVSSLGGIAWRGACRIGECG